MFISVFKCYSSWFVMINGKFGLVFIKEPKLGL